MYSPSDFDSAHAYFERARSFVCSSRYCDEIEWQRTVCVDHVTEQDFLRECAWVILNSGFRESVARDLFPTISLAFFDWTDAKTIRLHEESCMEIASLSFRHNKKLKAMVNAAVCVDNLGMAQVKCDLKANPIEFLMTLDWIGPITAWHLAKNLGCDVAKPDRHLARVAKCFGYQDVHTLCFELSQTYNEKISVIDLILWRFSASHAELAKLS